MKGIKGKLSKMPNTWQVVGICAAMLTLVFSAVGVALAVAKYLQIGATPVPPF